jgi:small subunit ribosomal protein S20
MEATQQIRQLYLTNKTQELKVANHKSAAKRNLQNQIRNARNNHVRSTMRTLVKNTREAVAKGDKDAAQQALKLVIPCIDKSAARGVIHKSTASRKIGRLTKLVNTLA